MRKIFPFLALGLLLTGCFDDTGTEIEAYVLCNFDPEDRSSAQESYMNYYFNGGKDSVYVVESYYYAPMIFHGVPDGGERALKGGFAVCCGKKEDVTEESEPSRYATLQGGSQKSLGYAIFRQSAEGPVTPLEFYRPNNDSYVLAAAFLVNITHAAHCAALFGTGLSGGPFDGEDFLKLTVTGYNGSEVAGTVETDLISGKKPIEDWTNVDITPLSKVTAMDFTLTCSRPDFPMDFCVDNFLIDYIQKY